MNWDFDGLDQFLAMPKPSQLAIIDAITPEQANTLFSGLVKRAERTKRRPVELDVLQRILETAAPDEYLEDAQPADLRLALKKESLARIRRERREVAKRVLWEKGVSPTSAAITEAVSDWLDETQAIDTREVCRELVHLRNND